MYLYVHMNSHPNSHEMYQKGCAPNEDHRAHSCYCNNTLPHSCSAFISTRKNGKVEHWPPPSVSTDSAGPCGLGHTGQSIAHLSQWELQRTWATVPSLHDCPLFSQVKRSGHHAPGKHMPPTSNMFIF